jgi:hypothetical protein
MNFVGDDIAQGVLFQLFERLPGEPEKPEVYQQILK